ncbi:hypothetical protein [Halomicrobium urmianum]|uniref:hypothetical protein n=1 Tax=Halomicrobium urmianum TaxID=1586233 RepID=UPI001CD9B32A|nr:hypothetical protein [Halomicrobium urmianum]
MTTVAVMAQPPEPGVLPELVADDVLSEAEAADLYEAMLADVCETVDASGGDLLVNYRPADGIDADVDDPEATVREVVDPIVDEDPRYEVQVGSTFSARVGNTVTHLLEREGVRTVGVLRPSAALCGRQRIDSAAMKLRTSTVVLGPSTGGGVYYAAFEDTIDFEDAFATPAVETLVHRANDAGHDVDFVPPIPTMGTRDDLLTAVPQLRAHRESGGRWVPRRTIDVVDSLGLRVEDGPTLVRE